MTQDLSIRTTLDRAGHERRFVLSSPRPDRWVYLAYDDGAPVAFEPIGNERRAGACRDAIERQAAQLVADGWTRHDEAPLIVDGDIQTALVALVELVAAHPEATGAIADPVWRAYDRFVSACVAHGVPLRFTAATRATAQRRLGELAEQRGDYRAALVFYRAAVLSDPGVGVSRRLAALERLWR